MPESQENKMQFKIFACPRGKYHSAYSLNELNLALARKYWHNIKKNLRSFLSFLDWMQWAKNPSHATVPLSHVTYKGELNCLTCAGLNGEEDGPEDVRVVVAPLVLYHGDQALQAHPAINMLAEQNFYYFMPWNYDLMLLSFPESNIWAL